MVGLMSVCKLIFLILWSIGLSTLTSCVKVPEKEFDLRLYQFDKAFLECPSGWQLYRNHCYLIVKEETTFQQADILCKRYGGYLVKIDGYNDNDWVGKLITDSNITDVWLGLQRKKSDDFHWSDGQLAEVEDGYWAEQLPIRSSGYDLCTVLGISVTDFGLYRWRLVNCEIRYSSICQSSACVAGQYRCRDGSGCISHSLVCDGIYQCGDHSDEQDCPGSCGEHLQGRFHTFHSPHFPNRYPRYSSCIWKLETPVGTRIKLEFDSFDLETLYDKVIVHDGSSERDPLVGIYSGTDIPIVPYSSSNFYLVIFQSDQDNQLSGFNASFTAEPVSECGMILHASEKQQWFASPNYPNPYPNNILCDWVIRVDNPLDLISLQFNNLALDTSDFIEIRQGESLDSPLYGRYTGDILPPVFIATSQSLLIRLYTDYTRTGAGFNATFHTGCINTVKNGYARVMSPGYSITKYPNYLNCNWTIIDPLHRDLLVIFDGNFDTERDYDILNITVLSTDNHTFFQHSGQTIPPPIEISTGQFHINFYSDNQVNRVGWSFTVSFDCPTLSLSDHQQINSSSTKFGTYVRFSCDSGYQLTGTSLLICDIGGRWSASPPTCDVINCGSPTIPDHMDLVSVSSTFFLGQAKYKCHPGFTSLDTSIGICQNNGKWTLSVCYDVYCPKINVTEKLLFTTTSESQYRYGDIVSYRCGDNYRLMGASMVYCKENGTWSNATPRCIAPLCPPLYIPNGSTNVTNRVVGGSFVHITCNHGYRLMGNEVVACGLDGVFTPLPTCQDIDECTDDTVCGLHYCQNTPGSYRCACNQGYQNPPENYTVCQDVDECSSLVCSDVCDNYQGGYECKCQGGQQMYTDEVRVVKRKILRPNSTCIAVCPKFTVANGGIVIADALPLRSGDYVAPTIMTIHCPIGTIPDGSATVECRLDGQWNDTVTSCQDQMCSPLASPAHGLMLYLNGTKTYNTMVAYSCDPDYRLVGAELRFCLPDNNTGRLEWTGTTPFCQEITCPAIPDPTNGKAEYISTSIGAIAELSCDCGYQLIGSKTRTCQPSGLWDGRNAICVSTSVCQPPVSRNVFNMTPALPFYTIGTEVNLQCNKPGYKLADLSPLKCVIQQPPTETTRPHFTLDYKMNFTTPAISDQKCNKHFLDELVEVFTQIAQNKCSHGPMINISAKANTSHQLLTIDLSIQLSMVGTGSFSTMCTCSNKLVLFTKAGSIQTIVSSLTVNGTFDPSSCQSYFISSHGNLTFDSQWSCDQGYDLGYYRDVCITDLEPYCYKSNECTNIYGSVISTPTMSTEDTVGTMSTTDVNYPASLINDSTTSSTKRSTSGPIDMTTVHHTSKQIITDTMTVVSSDQETTTQYKVPVSGDGLTEDPNSSQPDNYTTIVTDEDPGFMTATPGASNKYSTVSTETTINDVTTTTVAQTTVNNPITSTLRSETIPMHGSSTPESSTTQHHGISTLGSATTQKHGDSTTQSSATTMPLKDHTPALAHTSAITDSSSQHTSSTVKPLITENSNVSPQSSGQLTSSTIGVTTEVFRSTDQPESGSTGNQPRTTDSESHDKTNAHTTSSIPASTDQLSSYYLSTGTTSTGEVTERSGVTEMSTTASMTTEVIDVPTSISMTTKGTDVSTTAAFTTKSFDVPKTTEATDLSTSGPETTKGTQMSTSGHKTTEATDVSTSGLIQTIGPDVSSSGSMTTKVSTSGPKTTNANDVSTSGPKTTEVADMSTDRSITSPKTAIVSEVSTSDHMTTGGITQIYGQTSANAFTSSENTVKQISTVSLDTTTNNAEVTSSKTERTTGKISNEITTVSVITRDNEITTEQSEQQLSTEKTTHDETTTTESKQPVSTEKTTHYETTTTESKQPVSTEKTTSNENTTAVNIEKTTKIEQTITQSKQQVSTENTTNNEKTKVYTTLQMFTPSSEVSNVQLTQDNTEVTTVQTTQQIFTETDDESSNGVQTDAQTNPVVDLTTTSTGQQDETTDSTTNKTTQPESSMVTTDKMSTSQLTTSKLATTSQPKTTSSSHPTTSQRTTTTTAQPTTSQPTTTSTTTSQPTSQPTTTSQLTTTTSPPTTKTSPPPTTTTAQPTTTSQSTTKSQPTTTTTSQPTTTTSPPPTTTTAQPTTTSQPTTKSQPTTTTTSPPPTTTTAQPTTTSQPTTSQPTTTTSTSPSPTTSPLTTTTQLTTTTSQLKTTSQPTTTSQQTTSPPITTSQPTTTSPQITTPTELTTTTSQLTTTPSEPTTTTSQSTTTTSPPPSDLPPVYKIGINAEVITATTVDQSCIDQISTVLNSKDGVSKALSTTKSCSKHAITVTMATSITSLPNSNTIEITKNFSLGGQSQDILNPCGQAIAEPLRKYLEGSIGELVSSTPCLQALVTTSIDINQWQCPDGYEMDSTGEICHIITPSPINIVTTTAVSTTTVTTTTTSTTTSPTTTTSTTTTPGTTLPSTSAPFYLIEVRAVYQGNNLTGDACVTATRQQIEEKVEIISTGIKSELNSRKECSKLSDIVLLTRTGSIELTPERLKLTAPFAIQSPSGDISIVTSCAEAIKSYIDTKFCGLLQDLNPVVCYVILNTMEIPFFGWTCNEHYEYDETSQLCRLNQTTQSTVVKSLSKSYSIRDKIEYSIPFATFSMKLQFKAFMRDSAYCESEYRKSLLPLLENQTVVLNDKKNTEIQTYCQDVYTSLYGVDNQPDDVILSLKYQKLLEVTIKVKMFAVSSSVEMNSYNTCIGYHSTKFLKVDSNALIGRSTLPSTNGSWCSEPNLTSSNFITGMTYNCTTGYKGPTGFLCIKEIVMNVVIGLSSNSTLSQKILEQINVYSAACTSRSLSTTIQPQDTTVISLSSSTDMEQQSTVEITDTTTISKITSTPKTTLRRNFVSNTTSELTSLHETTTEISYMSNRTTELSSLPEINSTTETTSEITKLPETNTGTTNLHETTRETTSLLELTTETVAFSEPTVMISPQTHLLTTAVPDTATTGLPDTTIVLPQTTVVLPQTKTELPEITSSTVLPETLTATVLPKITTTELSETLSTVLPESSTTTVLPETTSTTVLPVATTTVLSETTTLVLLETTASTALPETTTTTVLPETTTTTVLPETITTTTELPETITTTTVLPETITTTTVLPETITTTVLPETTTEMLEITSSTVLPETTTTIMRETTASTVLPETTTTVLPETITITVLPETTTTTELPETITITVLPETITTTVLPETTTALHNINTATEELSETTTALHNINTATEESPETSTVRTTLSEETTVINILPETATELPMISIATTEKPQETENVTSSIDSSTEQMTLSTKGSPLYTDVSTEGETHYRNTVTSAAMTTPVQSTNMKNVTSQPGESVPPTTIAMLLPPTCYVCGEKKEDSSCNVEIQQCSQGSSCSTRVDYDKKKIVLTKKCMDTEECNRLNSTLKCDPTNYSSTCMYCCLESLCNNETPFLQFEEGRRKKRAVTPVKSELYRWTGVFPGSGRQKRSTDELPQAFWNSTLPTCIDIESPVFQNCPQQSVVLYKEHWGPVWEVVSLPSVVDNSGLTPRITVTPDDFRQPYLFRRNMTVSVLAEDTSGNSAYCDIKVTVIDAYPLTIHCPVDVMTVPYHTIEDTVLTNYSGVMASKAAVQVTFSPPNGSPVQIKELISVTATAHDRFGNTTSCQFTFEAMRNEQLPQYSIRLNYSTPALEFNDNCSREYVKQIIGKIQDIGENISDCKDRFTLASNLIQDIPEKLMIETSVLFANFVTLDLDKMENCGQTAVTKIKALGNITVTVATCPDYTLTLLDEEPAQNFLCESKYMVLNKTSKYCSYCRKGTYVDWPAGKCEVCPLPPHNIQPECRLCTGNDTQCLGPCKPGEYSPTGLQPCTKCSEGAYSDVYNSTICKSCPDSKWTISTGTNSLYGCLDICHAGAYSSTGMVPCKPCPTMFYSNQTKSQSCTECPAGLITSSTGSSSISQCQDPLVCSGGECNGGTCIPVDNGRHFTCQCPPGFTGTLCELPIQECSSNPCIHGNCIDKLNGYSCTCQKGFTGQNCETNMDDCTPGDCINGTCVDGDDSSTCLCYPGYTGSPVCTEINECDPDPCKNGGVCIDLINDFICNCSGTGHVGQRCDQLPERCYNGSCLNDGVCHPHDNGYSCSCAQGFTGIYCEVNIDDCDGHYCKNGAMCVDGVDQYTCLCQAGFTGDQCSINMMCDINPCLNGAECMITTTGYQCNCLPGYSGVLCEINIDECKNNMCNPEKSQCKDKINSYTCDCLPGWTGKYCTEPVNECLSTPCAHGSACKDLDSQYSCVCQEGFTGHNCSVDIDECDSSPCFNGGECTDGVNGYQCTCRGSFEGSNCHIHRDLCADLPCLNNGTCQNLVDGYLCKCEPGWKGQTCETMVNNCISRPCYNNGTCVNGINQYSCNCNQGYTGSHCQEDVNECLEQPCRNGGQCVNLIGGYRCLCLNGFHGHNCNDLDQKCPVCQNGATDCNSGNCVCLPGFVGPDCGKERNPGYDLYFHSNTSLETNITGMKNREELSLCLWVKALSPADHQSIFTLQAIDRQNKEQEVISLTTSVLHLGNYGDIWVNLTLTPGVWTYLCFTWDSNQAGHWKVYIDGQLQIEGVGYGNGQQLPTKQKIALGKPTLENSTAFHGLISQFNVYDYILNSTTISNSSVNCSASLSPGSVFRWAEFSAYVRPGIGVEEPSVCDSETCPGDYHGMFCKERIDTKPPSIEYCPEYVQVLTSSRLNIINWTEPRFVDDTGIVNVVQTHRPGQVFAYGEYDILYIAYDKENNTAVCIFTVYIIPSNCSLPVAPPGVTVTCNDWSEGISCSVRCKNPTVHNFVEEIPPFYKCGREGFWDPPRGRNFTFPICAESSEPSSTLKGEMVFLGPVCSTEYKHLLSENFNKNMNQWNMEFGLCPSAGCNFSQVIIACDEARRRKRTTDSTYYLSFDIPVNGSLMSDSVDALPLTQLETMIKNKEFNTADFSCDPAKLKVKPYITCHEGQILINGLCVNCAKGTYFDSTTGTCEVCQRGQYTNQEKQVTCQSCGLGFTTENTGSTSSSACYKICPAGDYYEQRISGCKSCSKGFYQDLTGETTCKSCGNGQTTQESGSTSIDDCQSLCRAGTELSIHGICEPCALGTYKSTDGQDSCLPCPYSKSTEKVGAISQDQCSVESCPQDFYYDLQTKGCKVCPPGYHQPYQGQRSCIPCTKFDLHIRKCSSGEVDECVLHQDNCDDDADCIDTKDSFQCQCKWGYTGNGTYCVGKCVSACQTGLACIIDNNGEPVCQSVNQDSFPMEAMVGGGAALAAVLMLVFTVVICKRRSQRKKRKNGCHSYEHIDRVHRQVPVVTYPRGVARAVQFRTNPAYSDSDLSDPTYLGQPTALWTRTLYPDHEDMTVYSETSMTRPLRLRIPTAVQTQQDFEIESNKSWHDSDSSQDDPHHSSDNSSISKYRVDSNPKDSSPNSSLSQYKEEDSVHKNDSPTTSDKSDLADSYF